jgi:ParB family chromosome partitioning protein
MDITTVAPHLELLDLPPELDAAMKSGRCTSPKTLHELNKLHLSQPEDARALLAGDGNITRAAVAVARASVVAKRKAPNATRYDSRSAGRPTCQTRWSPLPEGAGGSRA